MVSPAAHHHCDIASQLTRARYNRARRSATTCDMHVLLVALTAVHSQNLLHPPAPPPLIANWYTGDVGDNCTHVCESIDLMCYDRGAVGTDLIDQVMETQDTFDKLTAVIAEADLNCASLSCGYSGGGWMGCTSYRQEYWSSYPNFNPSKGMWHGDQGPWQWKLSLQLCVVRRGHCAPLLVRPSASAAAAAPRRLPATAVCDHGRWRRSVHTTRGGQLT